MAQDPVIMIQRWRTQHSVQCVLVHCNKSYPVTDQDSAELVPTSMLVNKYIEISFLRSVKQFKNFSGKVFKLSSV